MESQYWQQVSWFRTDITDWDTIGKNAYLVHHHNTKKVTHGCQEKTVKVVTNGSADLAAECIHEHLARNEKENTKGNISKRPTVLESSSHQKDLHGNVNKQLGGVQEVQHNEKADSVCGTKTSPALERGERNKEANGECDEGANAQHPHGHRRAILVKLKPDETVDQQASDGRTAKTVLDADKIRVRITAGRHDTGVDDEGYAGEEHVQVEEAENLLSSDSGELGTYVEDHDDGHEQSDNMHGAGGAFKDDCVCDLDVTGIAVGLDASAAIGS